MKIIESNKVPKPIGPYSIGKMTSSGLLFISGQLGMDVEGKLESDIQAQTKKALLNMGEVLAAADMTYDNVVKVTVLMADLNDFEEMNSVYASLFSDSLPARAAYQVSRLPKDALVEIEAIAAR